MNFKLGTVLLVRRGLGGIVFVVDQAGDVGHGAFLRGHPKVRGAGIEHYLEHLRGVAQGNGTVVLRLKGIEYIMGLAGYL